MSFYDQLDRIAAVLQQRGRASYRGLKREFDLDDGLLEDLKAELIDVQHRAREEDGTVLVWIGGGAGLPAAAAVPSPAPPEAEPTSALPAEGAAERRQVTVMFCDLVRSTELAGRLDPEDLRDLLRAYQDAAGAVVDRFGGVIARCVGDGLLIYFGYPQAHEDDASRAVRAGLGIVGAVRELQTRLEQTLAPLRLIPLQVRVGLHTGIAVVTAIGDLANPEALAAVGETPQVAVRIQGCAEPDTVLLTEATHRLLRGAFTCIAVSSLPGEGLMPAPLYRVLGEAQAVRTAAAGYRPSSLVGREQEMGLLLERWAQATEGLGQVVLITGEAGIGKSRLVRALEAHAGSESSLVLEGRGSPFHQHSAWHPLAELLRHALELDRPDPDAEPLARLEEALRRRAPSAEEDVPFLAPLLGVPLSEARRGRLSLSPERHRQRTLEAAVALVLGLSARVPVLLIVEDLHWVDPSTLEWLTLLVEQAPTARLFVLLTARPEFASPWAGRAHTTALTVSRLRRAHIEQLIQVVAGDKPLPRGLVEQVVTRTDGVPLFVEELTKMVLESGWLREGPGGCALEGGLPRLSIPATLQDLLLARLDRLSTVKTVAQLGAAIGRSFSGALLREVSGLGDDALRRELDKLVGAELLYQRGVFPDAVYTFKHALIQEAAYETLLRNARQHHHRRIARALEQGRGLAGGTPPEVLAHHYTEAGLGAEAIPHWQRAGEAAAARAAFPEAIEHLTRGLSLLDALPSSPERARTELVLRLARGSSMMAVRGHSSPEVEQEYNRARELCQHVDDSPLLFRVLGGLRLFYFARADFATSGQFAEQCLALAERRRDPVQIVRSGTMLGQIGLHLGEIARAHEHFGRAIGLHAAGQYPARTTGQDPVVLCLSYDAWCLWLLGFPERALHSTRRALSLAQERAQPHDLAGALHYTNVADELRRDGRAVAERAGGLIALAREQGYPIWLGFGLLLQGWAGAHQGRGEAGLAEMREAIEVLRSTGLRTGWPYYLALVAGACRALGHVDEALRIQAEAIEVGCETGEHCWDAELWRLKGELLGGHGPSRGCEAEACFRRAIEVARAQGARSWELRAATSLGRLLGERGEPRDGRDVLAECYSAFTEGFDTPDLQDARTLLASLGRPRAARLGREAVPG